MRLTADLSSRSLLAASWAALIGLHLALFALALALRPLLPVDETRYVSVAWEMWARGDLLVPYLNGAPYSHKPPLLFWLIQAGWAVTGVNEWWPRLVPVLVSLGCLGLISSLARRLWPQRPSVALLAPWLVFGSLAWLAIFTLIQFDLLLVLATLIGVHALLSAADGERPLLGWGGLGAAIGLGVLAKGPVILVHLLPLALLYPLWASPESRRVGLARWYLGVLAAVVVGAGIGLAWALPAAWAGGEAYAHAIFWGQSADRMVDSFAHREPWWFYLPWLLALLLPWVIWPTLWRAGVRGSRALGGRPLRLLLLWAVTVLLAFSAISGKQAKYLLPMLPALWLLITAALAQGWPEGRRVRLGVAGLPLVVLGAALAVLGLRGEGAAWVAQLPVWAGPVLIAVGVAPWFVRVRRLMPLIGGGTLLSVLALAAFHLAVVPAAAPAYDLAPTARRLAAAEAEGRPLAVLGSYHGQFHFLGRLTRRLPELDPEALADWLAAHPNGWIVTTGELEPTARAAGLVPFFETPYRGDQLRLWSLGRHR